eukprot:6176807-Pleurochrysis_carterae.AAC.2
MPTCAGGHDDSRLRVQSVQWGTMVMGAADGSGTATASASTERWRCTRGGRTCRSRATSLSLCGCCSCTRGRTRLLLERGERGAAARHCHLHASVARKQLRNQHPTRNAGFERVLGMPVDQRGEASVWPTLPETRDSATHDLLPKCSTTCRVSRASVMREPRARRAEGPRVQPPRRATACRRGMQPSLERRKGESACAQSDDFIAATSACMRCKQWSPL